VSTEAFWIGVGVYNETTWPIALTTIVVAVFLIGWVFLRPGAKTDMWVKVFFSFAFAWNGIVFFLIFLRNPISMFFGTPLFIIVSLLFAVDIWAKKTLFRPPEAMWKKGITILWIVLVFLYPVIGWPLGHVYPKTLLPMFPWSLRPRRMWTRKSSSCCCPGH